MNYPLQANLKLVADVQRREKEAMEVAEAAEGEATKRRVGNTIDFHSLSLSSRFFGQRPP